MSRGRHVPFPNVPPLLLAEAVTRQEDGLQQLNNESAEAYKAFVHYCVLGPEARVCEVADAIGKSRALISTYRARHHWGARIEDWWRARQDRERQQNDGQPKVDLGQKEERKEDVRREEWELHAELIEAAKQGLERWRASDKVPTFVGIAKLLELASRLGRLAAGLPLNYTEISGNPEHPLRLEIEAALERVYGGEVVEIDGEVVNTKPVETLPEVAPDLPGSLDGEPLHDTQLDTLAEEQRASQILGL